MNIVRTTLLVLVIIVLTACGVAGKKFVRPSGNLIQVGKTTENQVIAAMGDPVQSHWGKRSGKKIKINIYAYVVVPGAEAIGRDAVFYFLDGVLVGYYFSSAFADETTDFDITRVGNIVENESKRQDVESILGKPAGEAIFPFPDYPEGRVLLYRFDGPMGSKEADFELDKDGIVRHFRVEVIPKKK